MILTVEERQCIALHLTLPQHRIVHIAIGPKALGVKGRCAQSARSEKQFKLGRANLALLRTSEKSIKPQSIYFVSLERIFND